MDGCTVARRPRLVVSCEHGGNRIPARWRPLFARANGLLSTHRGLDRGAARLARVIARHFGAGLHVASVSRLVVDLNRSPHHRDLFSRFTRGLSPAERRRILARHYAPYRDGVEREIVRHLAAGNRVFHLSVHSFTPVLRGEVRRTDVGLLYDPARQGESDLADRWIEILKETAPRRVVRRNHPYRGTADGFMVHLRRRFPATRYAGIELEVSQRHVGPGGSFAPGTAALVVESVARLIEAERAR